MRLTINGAQQELPEDWRHEPLLYVLREYFGLAGVKFGCGLGQCGACTVIVDGEAVRSCLLNAGDLVGQEIETIEGLAPNDGPLHPVQEAWMTFQVPQCGYCQAGQIMTAVALLRRDARPGDDAITEAFDGHLCRCGTQGRVKAALHHLRQRA